MFIGFTDVNLVVRDCNALVLRDLDNLQLLNVKCEEFLMVMELLLYKAERILDRNWTLITLYLSSCCLQLRSVKILGVFQLRCAS